MTTENTPGWKLGRFIDKHGDNPAFIILVFIPMIPLAMISMVVSWFHESIWFCNVFGWHKAPKEQGFDGCSANGVCPVCGKEVLQDSQGNWF